MFRCMILVEIGEAFSRGIGRREDESGKWRAEGAEEASTYFEKRANDGEDDDGEDGDDDAVCCFSICDGLRTKIRANHVQAFNADTRGFIARVGA
jgi:hypothetical protein